MLYKENDLDSVLMRSFDLIMESLLADIPRQLIQILLPVDYCELAVKPRIIANPQLR